MELRKPSFLQNIINTYFLLTAFKTQRTLFKIAFCIHNLAERASVPFFTNSTIPLLMGPLPSFFFLRSPWHQSTSLYLCTCAFKSVLSYKSWEFNFFYLLLLTCHLYALKLSISKFIYFKDRVTGM